MGGLHGEAKTWHGARAARRGLANMKIQAYLTAAAINLKLRRWAELVKNEQGSHSSTPPKSHAAATAAAGSTSTVRFSGSGITIWIY
jgi:hypothetical protein